ncbi:hypothetical protein DM40_2116 [Burkholderia cenocepacia]|nr:hypothetical protein DM40_2116 [Burkholderia cenocepacia]
MTEMAHVVQAMLLAATATHDAGGAERIALTSSKLAPMKRGYAQSARPGAFPAAAARQCDALGTSRIRMIVQSASPSW